MSKSIKRSLHFDQVARNYETNSGKFPWKVLRDREWKAVSNCIKNFSGLTVLDLGCGSGFYSRRLRDRGAHSVMAVDESEKMLSGLKDEERISVFASSIETFSTDTKFDLIIAAGVLEFLAEPLSIFGRAAKFAKKDCKLVLLFPEPNTLSFIYKCYHQLHGIKIKLLPLDRLEESADEHGWKISLSQKASVIATAAIFKRN